MNIKKIRERITENFAVKIICLIIAVFIFFFHELSSLETKTLAVPLDVRSLGDTVVLSGLEETPFIKVRIRGKKDDIASISENDLEAFVDITTAEGKGSFKFPVFISKDSRISAIEALEIKISPETVNLELDEVFSKLVDIEPSVIGVPSYGYEKAAFSSNPKRVKISGPRTLVEKISALSAQDVDITGASSDVVRQVRLKNPSSKIMIENPIVEIEAKVRAQGLTRTFSQIQVDFTGLPEYLTLENDYAAVDLSVEGEILTLEKLSPSAIVLTASCASIERAGTYSVMVTPVLPRGIKLLSISADELFVDVREKEISDDSEETDEDEATEESVPKTGNDGSPSLVEQGT
ncbi:MAG: YbbR-like domain-containing protein [Treponema sp.]|nr:YbbR-like domain-containing protein [Treponema sp.]